MWWAESFNSSHPAANFEMDETFDDFDR